MSTDETRGFSTHTPQRAWGATIFIRNAPQKGRRLHAQTYCEGLGFAEGPCFDQYGTLHVVDLRGARVLRVIPGGSELLSEPGGGPNGAAFGSDGRLYVANNGGLMWGDDGKSNGIAPNNEGGWVDRIDTDGSVERLYTECEGESLHAPNDIVFDPDGNFYFTDPKHGTREKRPPGYVCFAAPDGSNIQRVASDLRLPNGIALSEDGHSLFVAETIPRILWRFDIDSPGRLSNRYPLAELPPGYLPDGMCIDSQGRIICCAVAGGGVFAFAPDGELDHMIELDASDATNCAFGGPDFSTLYVTQGDGRVVTLEWDCPGAYLFPHN